MSTLNQIEKRISVEAPRISNNSNSSSNSNSTNHNHNNKNNNNNHSNSNSNSNLLQLVEGQHRKDEADDLGFTPMVNGRVRSFVQLSLNKKRRLKKQLS